MESSWLHVRRLPKRGITVQDIEIAVESFLPFSVKILRVVLLHGHGQALLHLDSDEKGIEEFLNALPGLNSSERLLHVSGWTNPWILQRGRPRIDPLVNTETFQPQYRSVALGRGWDVYDTSIIAVEVERALNRIVRQIVHEDNIERTKLRREIKRKFQQDMKLIDMKSRRHGGLSTINDLDRGKICWEYVRQGGRRMCSQSSTCFEKRLLHVFLPVKTLPSHMRVFVLDDSFPLSREASDGTIVY